MTGIAQRITAALGTLAIVAGVAVLSASPSVRALPEGMAVVKLSFSHGGPRNCRELSVEELSNLPANMRRKEVCDRARAPIYLELDLDGATMLAEELPPSGIAGDGPSRIYRRFTVSAGTHQVAVRLRERAAGSGFDFVAERQITLTEAQSFAIDFRPEMGGFIFN